MKYAIWDICMSEKRCLEIQNRAFYGLFFKSIRYLKMSYIFTLHESYMKKILSKNHGQKLSCKFQILHENMNLRKISFM